MKIQKKSIISFLICVLILIAGTAVWASEPGEVVVETIDRGIKVLQDPSYQGISKFAERRQKLWDTVKPVFDFKETSRRSLGRNWLDLDPEQRKEFTDTFVKVLRDLYLGKSDSYQGEKVVYIREIVKGNRGKVQTNFYTVDQKKIVVDFSMHKKEGTWKIYDVIIEGVSIINSYRGQFNSILSKGSFEDLLQKLRDKSDEMVDID